MLNYPFKCSLSASWNTGNQKRSVFELDKGQSADGSTFASVLPPTHTHSLFIYASTHKSRLRGGVSWDLGSDAWKYGLTWRSHSQFVFPPRVFALVLPLDVVRVFICPCLRVSVLWDIFKEWISAPRSVSTNAFLLWAVCHSGVILAW